MGSFERISKLSKKLRMEFKTTIKGLIVIKPKISIKRFFFRDFQKKNYAKIIGNQVFVQDNFSKSKKMLLGVYITN